MLHNFIWLSAPLSLSLPPPVSLSLSVYNFPDEHNDEQRELTFDHDKILQGVYSRTSAVSLRGPIRTLAVQSGIWPALTTSRGYFGGGT